ncbi:MAG: hypothetical protein M3X11_14805 [Acidobacteriota bacterium]|nr:hypothetical protein [Acidobacteriota bacterium]
MKILFAAFASLMLGWFFTMDNPTRVSAFGDVQDQITKTITLAPGSNVRVSSINGFVIIETSDSDRAEINIQVKASSQEAMDRRPIIVDNTANSLTIRTENDREGKRGWDRGWVRHEVRLRLPRAISLKVSSVNGKVEVGQITGEIAVSSVNGRVDIAQAGTATELSSINGHTSVSIKRIGEGGLRVTSINGGVEIGLPESTNADVEVRSVNGGINADIPINVIGEMRRGQLIGKLGSGGAKITVTSVNGGVTLRGN